MIGAELFILSRIRHQIVGDGKVKFQLNPVLGCLYKFTGVLVALAWAVGLIAI